MNWLRNLLIRLLFRLLNQTQAAVGSVEGSPAWTITVRWNNRVDSRTVPTSALMITTPDGIKVPIIMSPFQLEILRDGAIDATADLRRQFGYTEAPDYDTRTVRMG